MTMYTKYLKSTGQIIEYGDLEAIPTADDTCGVIVGYSYPNGQYPTIDLQTLQPVCSTTVTPQMINDERDRRISLGFKYPVVTGKLYQSRVGTQDMFNITVMAVMASAKMQTGTASDDPKWLDQINGFFWIAGDNSHNPMTPAIMVDFAATAAMWVSANTLAASAIKLTQGGIPSEYLTDPRWPT